MSDQNVPPINKTEELLIAVNPETGQPYEPVPDEVLERAVRQVQNVVKGNGMSSLQVALDEFLGKVLRFEAYELFRMDPQITEKRVPGKQNGEVAGSHQDMRARMQNVLEKVSVNPDVKKLTIEMLRKRLDLGFALTGQSISLHTYNRNYVVHELCNSCGGRKYMQCAVCHGDGRSKCYRCKGTMRIDCPQCHGHRTVAAGGTRKICMRCNGNGKINCTQCMGKGATKCKNCKGDGRLNCQSCNATGWHSIQGHLGVKAKCSFWYDKEALIAAEQAPELPGLIDKFGPLMVTEKHADITFIEDVERLKQLDMEVKPDEYKIPYNVGLPWGDITFRLRENKIIKGKLFGFNPRLYYVDPFLEEPLMPNILKLEEAGRTRDDPMPLMKDASQLRAIAQALVLAARSHHGRAFESYQKLYPFGLLEETQHNILRYADAALKNVTRRPRLWGAIFAGIISAIALGGYYLSPARMHLYSFILDERARIGFDVLMLATIMAMSWYIVQANATKALQESLSHLLPPKKLKKVKPKPGKAGHVSMGIAFLLWLGIIPLTMAIGQLTPLWYEKLMWFLSH